MPFSTSCIYIIKKMSYFYKKTKTFLLKLSQKLMEGQISNIKFITDFFNQIMLKNMYLFKEFLLYLI